MAFPCQLGSSSPGPWRSVVLPRFRVRWVGPYQGWRGAEKLVLHSQACPGSLCQVMALRGSPRILPLFSGSLAIGNSHSLSTQPAWWADLKASSRPIRRNDDRASVWSFPGASHPTVKSLQARGQGSRGLSSGLLCSACTVSEAVVHGWPLPHPRALVSLQLSMPLSTRPWQKDSTSPSSPH